MNRAKKIATVTALLLLICLSASASAQQALNNATLSLTGAEGLYVRVSDLDPDLKEVLIKESISEMILRSEIERKLESAGIRAEPEELFRKTGRENCLFLKMEISTLELNQTAIKIADGAKLPQTKFMYRLRLEFRQEVSLARDAGMKVMAITWMRDDFGYRRLEAIHRSALSLTDIFVQEFQAANRP